MNRTVLVVEDDPAFCQTLSNALASAEDLQVVGCAGDLPEAYRLLKRLAPDVMLVDIGLPSGSGIGLICFAEEHLPRCETMVITVSADTDAVYACIRAGATGYLLKDAPSFDIVREVRTLCEGGSPISPTIARKLLLLTSGKTGSAESPSAEVALSKQERAVLAYSAKGYKYDEIAKLMGLSKHSVETYVKRSYRKLQVHGKTEAIFEARKAGLLDD